MTRFYHSIERQACFIKESFSWLGTPFSPNSQVKGTQGGVDCVHLASAVHVACGAIEAVEIPVLPIAWVKSWHDHHANSLLLDFFSLPAIKQRLLKIGRDETPEIGDVAVVRYGNTEHHVGLWCGGRMVHATTTAGVIWTSTDDPNLRKAIRSFYRFS